MAYVTTGHRTRAGGLRERRAAPVGQELSRLAAGDHPRPRAGTRTYHDSPRTGTRPAHRVRSDTMHPPRTCQPGHETPTPCFAGCTTVLPVAGFRRPDELTQHYPPTARGKGQRFPLHPKPARSVQRASARAAEPATPRLVFVLCLLVVWACGIGGSSRCSERTCPLTGCCWPPLRSLYG